MSLYDINSEINALLDMVDDDGVLSDEILSNIDNLKMAESDKIENIGLAIKNMTAEAEAIRVETDNLLKRRRTLENRRESLKAYLLMYLESAHIPKLSTARVVLSIRPSKAVVIHDESLIPGNYFKIKREVSRETIKDDLLNGVDVPGASYETRQNLQVR